MWFWLTIACLSVVVLLWGGLYLSTWLYVRTCGAPIVTMKGEKGDYYWPNGKVAKDAIRQVRRQLKMQKIPFKNEFFGGIYIMHKQASREAYDAFTHAGLPVASRAKIGGTNITIIDT